MISIPGSHSFAKLVMMSSAPAKSAGDARYAFQDPFIIPSFVHCPLQSRLQTQLGVRSFLRRTQLTHIFVCFRGNSFIVSRRG